MEGDFKHSYAHHLVLFKNPAFFPLAAILLSWENTIKNQLFKMKPLQDKLGMANATHDWTKICHVGLCLLLAIALGTPKLDEPCF